MPRSLSPFEDPRKFAEQRFEQLRDQLDAEVSPITAHIVIDAVGEKVDRFREGSITAEEFCGDAIRTYFSQRNFIGSIGARENLATLGHDVGALADVDSAVLTRMWEHNLTRPPICY
jgi:hypothetical protein